MVTSRLFVVVALVAGFAVATPPNIPTGAVAETQLNNLNVAVQGLQDGYSRAKFPHWITISGACNTRETVLKRDGTEIVTSSSCSVTSGKWLSPYDGKTWTNASDVDIDHVVPLSNAWKSGASSWTTSQRQDFANDLTNPQLITVTDEVNQAKGDKGPEEWKPSQTSYHCTYASMWVKVKSVYNLTITTNEKLALQTMLNTCGANTGANGTASNSTRSNTTSAGATLLARQHDSSLIFSTQVWLSCLVFLLTFGMTL